MPKRHTRKPKIKNRKLRHKLKAKRRHQREQRLGPPLARSYRRRNEVLKEIGFSSYKQYLKSGLWKSIRSEILAANPYCIRCGHPACEVHHAAYTKPVMLGKDLRRLFSICRTCHHKAEHDHTGKKTTLGRANRFLGIINAKGKPTRRKNTPPTHRLPDPTAPKTGQPAAPAGGVECPGSLREPGDRQIRCGAT